MAHIHRIGEPENESETKAITTLADRLPDDHFIFHNFEMTTGHGLPYEYDVAVVGSHAVYHVEVKGYRGQIRGDKQRWVFENGRTHPSPIPLANKKTKILAGRLKDFSRKLRDVWCETVVLLSDDRARAMLRDDQSHRVVNLGEAPDLLTDPDHLPVSTSPIDPFHDEIAEVILGSDPSERVHRIGLYDIIERINQTDEKTVFLAEHRWIRSRPQTILKVYTFDVYASEEEKERQIRAIFHDQEAMRLLNAHPNIIDTGEMFPWQDDKFVLPTEYVEEGMTLELLLDEEMDRQVTWAEKRSVVRQVASALRHAHEAGVIHRDVKPLNVVFSPESGVAKLVNFDLAHVQAAPQVRDPHGLAERLDRRYVAPEVWLDPSTASPASDVFSLGLLFYELITSVGAFDDIEAVIDAREVPLDVDLLLSELSTPGSEDFMDAPLEAGSVIERMCTFDPDARPQSMDEVIEELHLVGD